MSVTTVTATIRQLVFYCACLEVSVIDSSNWVVGGSDSSVAVETNTARRPANQDRETASGIHLTHAKDFLRTKTHINTQETHVFYTSCYFVGNLGVYVLAFICARVYARVPQCVCARAAGVFCRRCLRVVDVVVMGECSLTHTRSREQGSACIKRANKRSFPHQQPTADNRTCDRRERGCGGIIGTIINYLEVTRTAVEVLV